MERVVLEQEGRAGQATGALQAKQQRQQQSAVSAQHAQRRAAAARMGASAVVESRPLGKPVGFDGRGTITISEEMITVTSRK